MNKPWENEPTPVTTKTILGSAGLWNEPLRDRMSEMERRMRAAERLLVITIRDIYPLVPEHDILCDDIKAHLEAAKKEDKQ